ncbi:putative mucin TcMUCII, partial [Trypanosoma cruzi]
MMTCRLLCALLVLALCCRLSVYATPSDEDTAGNSGGNSDPTKSNLGGPNQVTQLPNTTPLPPKVSEGGKVTAESQSDLSQAQDQEKDEKSTNEEADRHENDKANDQNQKTNAINATTTTTTTTSTTTTTTTTTQAPRQPRLPLRHRHQVLRLQKHQLRRPPAHRHVFAKSMAASAALRGCVPRCCSSHPRWRTPLWA